AGDKIITAIAEILKLSGRQKDIICRWGGDEFAMLLNNAADDIAEQVCAEIRERCAARQMQPISLSISLGYSIAHANRDINSAIKEAEERMYRNKLFEDKSNRSSIIASLQRTLEEKSHETEEHTRRIYDHCLKMGQKLNMGHAKIDELLLLALMHDIGKIGIPDDILNKESPLSEEEWEIMKTHTAIGYRIASASPELSHIAYGILTHHEYYNGCGYPKGLRGKSIPRISRVLSIVDAYDVMTHDRPYRKALTREQAIAELKRCSGTQFDPVLVKMFIEILEETEHMAG
ncbi:MAG: HD-GYP domain-containing protein, partial [Bacillota bacterium]